MDAAEADLYTTFIETIEESYNVRDRLVEFMETCADQLAEGRNPYRIGAHLRAAARDTKLATRENRDNLAGLRAVIEEHAEG